MSLQPPEPMGIITKEWGARHCPYKRLRAASAQGAAIRPSLVAGVCKVAHLGTHKGVVLVAKVAVSGDERELQIPKRSPHTAVPSLAGAHSRRGVGGGNSAGMV